MTLTTRRATAIGALLAVTLVLSACQNLPRRTAGAKCKTVGEHAQDGTWVLKCGSNKRWNKLMTIAAANDAVANWLRSQVPPTPPAPPAPPVTAPPAAPALTSIGATNRAQIAESPGLVSPGLYSTTVPTGSACIIEVFGGPSRRVRGSSGGPLYMNLPAGMSVSTAGPCVWNKGDLPPVTMPATGDGMYRTGAEIQLGLYTAPGGSDCYWETSDNADGSLEVINDIYYGPGPQLAIIEAGDAYFTSDGCGPWTPLTALPAQYLQVASAIDNYPLQGLRAFYPGSQFTVTATPGVTTFTTPQFTLQIAPPDSGPFTAGDFTVSRYNFTAPGNVLVNVTSPGRGCNVIPGTATISDVVLDVDGSASSMHAIVFAECDGKRFAVNVQY
ncbi:MAG TPA: hypothetical protein PKY13_04230 [Microthrixaceae bacterium]|jgi:hypothetical protein|nr:hypothetical protein [Microthrixaceae bacterium]